MKTLLLAAVVAAGLALVANPASALDTLHIHCSNIGVTVGKYAANPNDVIDIDFNRNYWNIVFTLSDIGSHPGRDAGAPQVVSRNQQYDLVDRSDTQHAMWGGYFRKNPKLYMQGGLLATDTTLAYQETLMDTSRGNIVVMQQSAPCVITNPQPIAPAAPQVAQAPPPAYTAQAPSTGGFDAVGITSVGGKGAFVQVTLGSNQAMMLIDTGATNILVSPTLAEMLIGSGEAEWGEPTTAEIADGSTMQERTITIHELRIGRHVLRNVHAGVSRQDTMMLLGFPVLNQMGRFTIDTTNNLLIFG